MSVCVCLCVCLCVCVSLADGGIRVCSGVNAAVVLSAVSRTSFPQALSFAVPERHEGLSGQSG